MRKINAQKLNEEIEIGNIMYQTHPKYPLRILNYTRMADYGRKWNDITLQCRGLVINDKYEIIAQPFAKFFNMGQYYTEIPNLPFEVFEKMDGWYGILFFYDNKWQIATRASFHSDQALRCQANIDKIDMSAFVTTRTYLVEIIHPHTKIVVKYDGLDKLFILGAIETDTNEEIPFDQIKNELSGIDSYFQFTIKYDGQNDFDAMSKEKGDNREGYIVRFNNGFRMKIKFDDYCDLHAVCKDITNKEVWRQLRAGKTLADMSEHVPDEYDEWLIETVRQLREKFVNYENELYKIYNNIIRSLGPKFTMKEYAFAVLKDYKKISGFLFSIQNGSNYDEEIWDKIEPEFERTNLAKFKEQQDARRLHKD